MLNLKLFNSIFYLFLFVIIFFSCSENNTKTLPITSPLIAKEDSVWQAPDTNNIPKNQFGELVRYGRELILNTAYYIGPNGTVGSYLGNKMNCNNCHLQAGTVPYGFNFFSTHARYPQYRGRENRVLSLADRVNNCVERPHSGKPLPLNSKEILAITSYIKWLGESVPVNSNVVGDKPYNIGYIDRAADPVKGEKIYIQHCKTCHGINGEGKLKPNNITYEYPPLWGDSSYQIGSSVHRIYKMASFVYCNMPHNIATYKKPVLTIENAYDVVAFINDDRIHKRPQPITTIDYPNIKAKPIDYFKGPYLDSFPEIQHKFGPYQPIVDFYKSKNLKIIF